MIIKMKKLLHWFLLSMALLAGCSTPTQAPTQAPVQQRIFSVSLLYPTKTTEIEMGQIIKVIVRVTDEQDQPVKDANVSVIFRNPEGQVLGTVLATFGDGDVYRSKAWTIPHKTQAGRWTIKTEALSLQGEGQSESEFLVNDSTSEILYHKYGFWLDAPTLRGIRPTIGAERGDAENGLIRWGGQIPTQHILPENWVEVHWRKGNFNLDSPKAVRNFLLADVGDLGFTPVREIGEFKQVKFKRWDAWEAQARGQVSYQEMVWTVFYAPEVDKTYALSTTVVQPPSGIDANEVLLEHFDIDPGVQAQGVAPKPFIPLLPQPLLVSPEMGIRFTGLEQPIVLTWEPVKKLTEDEYYQVAVDYNYAETNIRVPFSTRETQFTLPESLYHQPNCAVFNWRITLMQQTGVDKKGNPVGSALSYPSLYRYIQWFYPPNEAPFDPRCPNAQF